MGMNVRMRMYVCVHTHTHTHTHMFNLAKEVKANSLITTIPGGNLE